MSVSESALLLCWLLLLAASMHAGFQRNPVPWYAVMLLDLAMLLSLALVTLPLYTVTTHSLRADRALIAELLDRKQLRKAGTHHG